LPYFVYCPILHHAKLVTLLSSAKIINSSLISSIKGKFNITWGNLLRQHRKCHPCIQLIIKWYTNIIGIIGNDILFKQASSVKWIFTDDAGYLQEDMKKVNEYMTHICTTPTTKKLAAYIVTMYFYTHKQCKYLLALNFKIISIYHSKYYPSILEWLNKNSKWIQHSALSCVVWTTT